MQHRSWGGKAVGERQKKGNPLMKTAAGWGEKHFGKGSHIQRVVQSNTLPVGLRKRGLEDLKEISVLMWWFNSRKKRQVKSCNTALTSCKKMNLPVWEPRAVFWLSKMRVLLPKAALQYCK